MVEARGLDIQFWMNLKNACREIIALEVAYLFNRPAQEGKSQATLGLWFADGRGAAVHASEVEEMKIETNHLLEGTGASLEFSVLNRQNTQELADVVKKGMVIYTREDGSLEKLRREILGGAT